MQEQHSHIAAAVLPATDDVPERVVSASYGFGLVVEDDARLGRVVSHSGGYPGFGSHMRWHPASGWGIVALGNRTYFPAHRICGTVLASIVEQHRAEHPADALGTRVAAHPRGDGRSSSRCVASWDDAARRPLVRAQRRPRPAAVPSAGRRSRACGRASARSPARRHPPVSTTPAQVRWWLEGAEGTAYAEVLLTPDREPLIQSLTVSTDPVPDTAWD